MSPGDFLAEAERRLAGAKYATEPVGLRGVPAIAARRKPFRVQWFLTQLKTTVVVCAVETVTREGWNAFLADSFELARAIRGGLPTGFQAGIGAVPVLAGIHVAPDAAAAAEREKPRVELFRGMSMPALVDLTHHRVHAYEGRQAVGAVYVPFLRKQRDLVASVATTPPKE